MQYHNGVPFVPSKTTKTLRKLQKRVAIDSRDRLGASQADYVVNLPEGIRNIHSVKLVEAEIPLVFGNFDDTTLFSHGKIDYNRTIRFIVLGRYLTATIAPGNYTTIESIVVALQTAMNEAHGSPNPYTVTIVGGFIRIQSTVATTFDFTSTSGAQPGFSQWGLGYFLGFNKIDVIIAANSNFTAQNLPILVTNTYLLMELDFMNKVDECAPGSIRTGTKDGFFAKIPLQNVPFGNMLFHFERIFENKSVLSPTLDKLQSVHVKFRFHDGSSPNFKNRDNSMLLEFECLDSGFDEYSSLEVSHPDRKF